MAKRKELEIHFQVEFVPVPPEMHEVRKASLLLLIEWIKEDLQNARKKETINYPETEKRQLPASIP